jgi:hypothetical protein
MVDGGVPRIVDRLNSKYLGRYVHIIYVRKKLGNNTPQTRFYPPKGPMGRVGVRWRWFARWAMGDGLP